MMAKISFTLFFILALIFSVTTMAPPVSATVVTGKETEQRRCEEILYRKGCTLLECGKKCYEKYMNKGGNGKCISNAEMTRYACYCFWNC
ncbi:PREDICTED: putative defensin-like protein 165 [Populus euphratica]|uniref:Defensin-like protein 165 n=1 Tax=Populus euphratica TaxID=75702 RepID=A0AAJ6VF65_POPEU|nr:PREDICTED: putative defensin-like protein 165 [Populus euphratica]